MQEIEQQQEQQILADEFAQLGQIRLAIAALGDTPHINQLKALEKRELDTRKIIEWRLTTEHNYTQQRIAALVGVNQSNVSRDLKSFTDDVLNNLKDVAEQEKLIQVAQLKHLVEELYAAWEDSKINEQQVTQRTADGQEIVTVRVKGREGDRGYITEIRNCLEDVRKILGADAPLKIAHTDAEGNDVAPSGVIIVLPDNGRTPASPAGGSAMAVPIDIS